jgi:hypothetical protein
MKTNIVKILAFAAAAATALSVNAANNAPVADPVGSVSVGYANENFYRGADIGDETLKVGAELHGTVAGVSTFGSVVTNQSIDGGADQYFITAGIASKLFDLDATTGYLHYENVPGEATGELFARLTASKFLNLSGIVYYELDNELWTTELGVSHSIDLDFATVTGSASIGNTEVSSSNDRTYHSVGVDARRELTADVDLVIGVEYVDADDSEDDTVFFTGVQVNF